MSDRLKVRTTMEPNRTIEVSKAEATDLARQGLLHEPSKTVQKETESNG